MAVLHATNDDLRWWVFLIKAAFSASTPLGDHCRLHFGYSHGYQAFSF